MFGNDVRTKNCSPALTFCNNSAVVMPAKFSRTLVIRTCLDRLTDCNDYEQKFLLANYLLPSLTTREMITLDEITERLSLLEKRKQAGNIRSESLTSHESNERQEIAPVPITTLRDGSTRHSS